MKVFIELWKAKDAWKNLSLTDRQECKNAFDALNATADIRPPKLIIRTKLQLEKILIEVEDNGSGIPNEIKDKILTALFYYQKRHRGNRAGAEHYQ
jgi:DNA topoisomerase VI subunit B